MNGVPFPDGKVVMFDAYLTDPPSEAPSTPPSRNPRVLGEKVTSPQTSDPYDIYYGIFIVASIVAGFTVVTSLLKKRKKED